MADSSTIRTNEMTTRRCSAAELLAQIGQGVLMSVGARDIVDLGDGIHFRVSRSNRKLVIKLALDDTYTVERVRRKPDYTYVSEDCVEGVHGDQISRVVLRLGDV